MYRIHQIKLRLKEDKSILPQKISKMTGANIDEWKIMKESIDARDKGDIKLVYTVDFSCKEELDLPKAPDLTYEYPAPLKKKPQNPPVIVGFGPCGIFAGLILADMGLNPIIIEQGKKVDERLKDVEAFWAGGEVNEESNVQFGEGGAGTFSDGKLTTGIKDSRMRKVLEEMAAAGGGDDILYKQKPHIGTDVLRQVVVTLRERIIEKGGKILFQSKMTDIKKVDGKVAGITLADGSELKTENLVLALGHSARDTLRLLKETGIDMAQKPFSIGVRIAHLQEKINKAQYGSHEAAKLLGPADYKLNHHSKNGRGVYTFCMCPGGEVIMAASQKGTVVTNGMSNHARDGKYANSGLLVDVRTEDFQSDDVLAGVCFQEKYEKLAFELGGSNGKPPKTTLKEFMGNKEDIVRKTLPPFATESIIEAIPYLNRRLRGFDDPKAILTAIESRSSSPVRIIRDKEMVSNILGIYPAGEGAGYAGGIVSAAVDGIKVAEQIISALND
ncbi:MAG: NAD(FAD)-utilizing dehydrogenase [Anaerovoracaceae bacterium]